LHHIWLHDDWTVARTPCRAEGGAEGGADGGAEGGGCGLGFTLKNPILLFLFLFFLHSGPFFLQRGEDGRGCCFFEKKNWIKNEKRDPGKVK
jgi:hypothetical protein